ncbi:MAG: N-acetylmuramoyl-L-alanine amidase family protein [Eubacterium sp.]|nr:N-acetylmuramoyl-L-alanine amidase family protein [Eubacterium sp.]
MKKLKKLCGAVLIAGFMLPQIALGSTDTAEAASGKWKQNGKNWWYSYSDGTYPKSKWEKIGGKWYHFDKSGYMQTGWQKISGKWYYFGTNGIMKTGWQKISGKWYYFASGVMKTGWLKSGGKWYYFDGSGVMVTGTKTIGGKSYTFGSDGVMKEESSSKTVPLAKAKVGDYITFGHYEQDNNLKNGKETIEWQVLDRKQDGSLLVLSKYALDCRQYNERQKSVTWETCTLRTWLNSTFLNTAFTSDEITMIPETTVKNDNNQHSRARGGNDTTDQVFLLSLDEAKKYIENDDTEEGQKYGISSARACKPTAYAVAQGAWFLDSDDAALDEYFSRYYGNCFWWLRSPGNDQDLASCTGFDGYLYGSGYVAEQGDFRVSVNYFAVRPAMWIKP